MGCGGQRVIHLFGGKPASLIAREVADVGGLPLALITAGELVGFAVHDLANQRLQLIVVVDEKVGERFQKFRIGVLEGPVAGRRIFGVEAGQIPAVGRVHNAIAKEVTPQIVGGGAGELTVAGDHAGEFGAPVSGYRFRARGEKCGCDHGVGPGRTATGIGGRYRSGIGAVGAIHHDGARTETDGVGTHANEVHAREKCRHAPEIGTRAAGKMQVDLFQMAPTVVAGDALHFVAEEAGGDFFGNVVPGILDGASQIHPARKELSAGFGVDITRGSD